VARYIPNQHSWFAFTPALTGTVTAPKVADCTGASVVTSLITGLTASTAGQAVPTPDFSNLFETSISGTVQATFQIDGYRDDISANDLLWTLMPRATTGYFFIALKSGGAVPIATDKIDVWPIIVLSRTVPNFTSGQVVACQITCAVPQVPGENVAVVP
jgi:hypothetical protein